MASLNSPEGNAPYRRMNSLWKANCFRSLLGDGARTNPTGLGSWQSIGEVLKSTTSSCQKRASEILRYVGGVSYRLALRRVACTPQRISLLLIGPYRGLRISHHISRDTPHFYHPPSTLFFLPITRPNLHIGAHQVHSNLFELHSTPVRTSAHEPFWVPSICGYRLIEQGRAPRHSTIHRPSSTHHPQ
jgi:hypothetical protein